MPGMAPVGHDADGSLNRRSVFLIGRPPAERERRATLTDVRATEASSTLYFGPWYRKSPFFESTLEVVPITSPDAELPTPRPATLKKRMEMLLRSIQKKAEP